MGQHLFVNGREVNSHVLAYAVKQSYHSLLPKEKNPTFILFLNLSPELVDVNVHPRKLEVRFADEKEIFSVFLRACKASLEKHVLAPSFSTQESFLLEDRPHQQLHKSENEASTPMQINDSVTTNVDVPITVNNSPEEVEMKTGESVNPIKTSPQFSGLIREDGQDGEPANLSNEGTQNSQKTSRAEIPEMDPLVSRQDEEELIPIGQINNSYIVCQQNDSIVIIDQHAAHERIRYEEIMEDFEAKKISVQSLLAPEQIELSLQEASLLNDNKELLSDLGFEIEHFGGNTFSVFAVPGYLVKEDIRGTVLGLIDDINNIADKGDLQTRKEKALTYAACRSAVKFGDPLSVEEQKQLCKRLAELKLPYTCPHGRPTMIKMTKEELEKKFGRTQ